MRRSWLWGAVAVGIAARAAAAIYQGNTMEALPGIADQISYHELAVRVLAGHGFTFAEGHWPATRAGEPTAHWSFAYTLYLAGVYGVFGVHPIVPRLLQALVAGVLHPFLTWSVARRLFGERAAVLAAWLAASYVYFVYYASALLTETFYFLGILWTLDAALRLAAAPSLRTSRRPWIELGLAVGMTGLLRQVFLLFVPVLFAWIFVARRETPAASSLGERTMETAKGLSLATIVVVLLITPWTVRNAIAYGTFVPLNTNAGFALFWGNHPVHGTSFRPLLGDGALTYADLIPAELRHLDEARLDQALLRRGLREIAADPMRFVLLSVSRGREYFRFWPGDGSGRVSSAARTASFGLLLPLIVWGAWIAATDRAPSPGRWLLFAWIAVYTLIHLATWTLIRYRLPVDVVLLVFAGVAASTVIEWRARLAARSAVQPVRLA